MSNSERSRIHVSFFIGLPTGPYAAETEAQLQTEADVVRLPTLFESYQNLTLKTALMMEYAAKNNYSMMFKLDDDNFVRGDIFADRLRDLGENLDSLYWGRLKRNVPVLRDPSSKWFEGKFNRTVFPDYMLGSGYVVGSDIISYVFSQFSDGNLTMYANEDASVGIWTEGLTLRRERMDQMVLQPDCISSAVLINGLLPHEHRLLLANLARSDNMCQPSFYLEVCRRQPCQCCVTVAQPFVQNDDVCCY